MDPEPTITIREATLEDAEPLQKYLVRLVAERLPVIFHKSHAPSIEEERHYIRRLQSEPRSALFLALAQEEIVGMLDIHGNPRQQCQHVAEFGMSVSQAWRRRGVATNLIEYLEHWAQSHGIKRIDLEVFENNPGAIRLYEKKGFAIEGRRVGAVEIDGAYIDIIQMGKLLNAKKGALSAQA